MAPLEPLTWDMVGTGGLLEMLHTNHDRKAQDKGDERQCLPKVLETREPVIGHHRSNDGALWSELARSQGLGQISQLFCAKIHVLPS